MTIVRTTRPNGTRRVRVKLDTKSKVEQSHKNQVNINTIIKKYQKTGLFPHIKKEPSYGDFVGVTDYHDVQNRILQAEHDFMLLPSEIRGRFKNDPGLLIAFVNDPENAAEAAELGLIPKPAKVPEADVKPAEGDVKPIVEDVTEPVEP